MKNILVSNIPAWSKASGSDTMSSLLEGYDKDKLACLYVKADVSDSPVCDRYFHIIESRVVRSVLKKGIETGEEYNLSSLVSPLSTDNSEQLEENKRINSFRNKRLTIFLLGRELLWKLGNWKSRALNAFLDDFKPEVLFFPIEGYIYFNRINEYIIKRCKPKKVIGYMWDDNFTYKQEPYCGPLSKLMRFLQRRSVKRLVKKCDTVFAICPKMKREVDETFGINSVLLTKPVKDSIFKDYEPSSPVNIVYTGNLLYGRFESIENVVNAIKAVNQKEKRVLLHIYTQTYLTERQRKKIDVPDCSVLHGAVPQSEVKSIQDKSDVLLFVESLSGRKPIARLSFSTKLTDYFAAGKCIWAIGNKDLGPIEYIKECDAGLVSTSRSEIMTALRDIAENPGVVSEYARRCYDCGQQRHSKDLVKETFAKSVIN